MGSKTVRKKIKKTTFTYRPLVERQWQMLKG
jgi:hypothetical protein